MATTLAATTRAHLAQLDLGYLGPAIGLDFLEPADPEEHALSVHAELDLLRLESYYQNDGSVPHVLRSMEAPKPRSQQTRLSTCSPL